MTLNLLQELDIKSVDQTNLILWKTLYAAINNCKLNKLNAQSSETSWSKKESFGKKPST